MRQYPKRKPFIRRLTTGEAAYLHWEHDQLEAKAAAIIARVQRQEMDFKIRDLDLKRVTVTNN